MKPPIAWILLICAFMSGCAGPLSSPQGTRIDEVPMYGGMDRSKVPELKAADEKLIVEASGHYGSREKAAVAFIDQGFRFYRQDNLGMAMRRFNQAWLLDPNNPEVYWGFGSILHDQEKMCEAMRQYDKALSFDRYISGMYPDAGRVFSLCGVQDKGLTANNRQKLYERADALYAEAAQRDHSKGYVYSSWASAYIWREQYIQSWEMVKKARETGGQLPPQFLSMLRSKMPEP